MSAKSSNARYSQSRTDTRIGSGVRVAGNVTFTGVLLVEGGVRGDLSCDADTKGTLVVGPSGHVAGAIKAPHIVVGGRVSGPSESSESIEIQSGACLVGDMSYNEIEVHAGGVIEGLMMPRLSPATPREADESAHAAGAQAERSRGARRSDEARNEPGVQPANWRGRTLGWVVALGVTAIAALWVNGNLNPTATSPAEVALKASSVMNGPADAPAAPAGSAAAQDAAKTDEGSGVAPVAEPAATTAPQVPGAGNADPDPAKVMTVQGVNPRKPASLFSVTSKEPAVLLKRKSQDTSGGTTIDVPANTTKTIAIRKDDVFRVVEGRDMMIFYQGRMVPPRTAESGVWMRFVPHAPGGADE